MSILLGVRKWLFVAALATGCGERGVCQYPSGFYEVRVTPVSGDCGFVTETVVLDWDAPPAPGGPSCEGGTSYAEEGCTIYDDWRCAWPDGASGTITRVVEWNEEASTGAGTATYSLKTPNGDSCLATTRMSYRRL